MLALASKCTTIRVHTLKAENFSNYARKKDEIFRV
jgi:hypothetical protein